MTLDLDTATAEPEAAVTITRSTAPAEKARPAAQRRKKPLLFADLFCGAGGTSTGAKKALTAMGLIMQLVAVNHWPVAISTHSRNHPEARHYCINLDSARPVDLVPEGYLDLLMASPECTHHSRARGGKPMNDQSRMSAAHIIRWCTDLRVKNVLIENVPEWEEWGPLNPKTGRPVQSRKGEYFRAFVAHLQAIGYRVEWRILNAADYGDATTRKRLFMIARAERKPIRWPEPTHSQDGEATLFGTRRRWRAARQIIDWTRRGDSIFGRKRPLAPKTLERTMAGARKFNWPAPYTLALQRALHESLTHYIGRAEQVLAEPMPTDAKAKAKAAKRRATEQRFLSSYAAPRLERLLAEMATGPAAGGDNAQPMMVVLRQHMDGRSVDDPLPTVSAGGMHVGIAEPTAAPFTCANRTNNTPQSIDGPIPSIVTSGSIFVVEPAAFVLSQGATGAPRDVAAPLPTIVGAGAISCLQPVLIHVTGGEKPKPARDVNGPLGTITTKNGVGMAEPCIVVMKGRSTVVSIDRPVPTATAHARHLGMMEGSADAFTFPVNQGSDRIRGQRSVNQPVQTILTRESLGLAQPLIAPYYGSGSGETCTGTDTPLPTVTAKARFGMVEPDAEAFIVPQFGEREGQTPRNHAVDAPLPAVTSHGAGALVQPVIVQFDQTGSVGGHVRSVDDPVFTVVTKQNQAVVEALVETVANDNRLWAAARQGRLVIIDDVPHVIDIRFRMLDPLELARAMGFSDEETTYEFVGTKTEVTKQIGNAVPVNTASALVSAIFSDVSATAGHTPAPPHERNHRNRIGGVT